MTTQPLNPTDVAAVRAELQRYVEAALDQDWAVFVTVFADNPICMPAGFPALRSRRAIREFYSRLPALDALFLETESLEVAGPDLVLEVGRYHFAAEGVADNGKYIHVWKRTGEGWRLYRNIANSDQLVATGSS